MRYLHSASKAWSVINRHLTRRRVFIAGGVLAIFAVVTPILTYIHYSHDISDPERLMNRNSTGIVIRDRKGEILYSYGKINGYPVLKLEQISDNLEQAVLASEDRDFYSHDGYSLKGIGRALYANVLNKDPTKYGGSTITQQLAKNKLLGNSKNYLRKYQEITVAMAIENKYSKKEIMEMYLNSVYFGEGAFGISAAAKTYFNKPASDLSLAESSMLVGLLPAPSAYSPISGDPDKAKRRQTQVLQEMVDTGYINNEQKEKISNKKLAFQPRQTEKFTHAQHFVMMVLDEITSKYGEEDTTRLGFDVTTTLDLDWQKLAEKRLRDKIQTIKGQGATNASLVAIDPKSGEIRALVGSVGWNEPGFGKVNMAVMPRQPGSSFKPIYYSDALDKKVVTAATILNDKALNFPGYDPQNFDFKFHGPIPLRNALAQSLNIPSIEVMQKLGIDEAANAAKKLQISTIKNPQSYGLTLALGTAEVPVLEMTNAYAAFANQGEQYKATKIENIKNKFGENVFEYEKKSEQTISPGASFLISSILSDNSARAPTFGNALTIEGKQVAVKTGTTDDSKDAWTLGYTPDLSIGVWVGNNQHKPMTGLIGSSSAGAIWRDTMTDLSKSQNPKFGQPQTVVQHDVCELKKISPGGLNKEGKEFFLRGTEPDDSCAPKAAPVNKEKDKPKPRENNEKPEKPKENEKKTPPGGRGGGVPEPTPEPPPDDGGGGTNPPPTNANAEAPQPSP